MEVEVIAEMEVMEELEGDGGCGNNGDEGRGNGDVTDGGGRR